MDVGVVSMHSRHFILLIAESNDLEMYQGDVGNAGLEAYIEEKIFFITGKKLTTFAMEATYLLINWSIPQLLVQQLVPVS